MRAKLPRMVDCVDEYSTLGYRILQAISYSVTLMIISGEVVPACCHVGTWKLLSIHVQQLCNRQG